MFQTNGCARAGNGYDSRPQARMNMSASQKRQRNRIGAKDKKLT